MDGDQLRGVSTATHVSGDSKKQPAKARMEELTGNIVAS